jgi:hypothetical protein
LDVGDGAEIRLFDPRRNRQNWTDLIARTDCAVFLKNRMDSTSLAPDGRPFARPADVTCVVFHSVDAARRYCEAKVRDLPQVRCEIYDADGPAHPPLLVILHPEFQQKEHSGSLWSRRRKLIMVVLILLSVPLFWFGARGSNASDVAIFMGINCLVLAMRFLYWDVGLKQSERKRSERLESHRERERDDA